MLHLNCQVCGNPMYSGSYCGTEPDGSINPDYCSSCYKGGQFYARHNHMQLSGAGLMPWSALYQGQGRGV